MGIRNKKGDSEKEKSELVVFRDSWSKETWRMGR